MADKNGWKYLGQIEPADCHQYTTWEAGVNLDWCIRRVGCTPT
jgi:hypothetical protein